VLQRLRAIVLERERHAAWVPRHLGATT
jgi:hypothetical protein